MPSRPVTGLFIALTALSTAATAAVSQDLSAPTVNQIVLGIETPAEWGSIQERYIGSMVLTEKLSSSLGAPVAVSRRLDATLIMNSDTILDDIVPATELTVDITRNETVIAKCVLDLGHSLGGQELQVSDYRLLLTERQNTPFQAVNGNCSSVDTAGSMTPGVIPEISEGDVIRLETTGLTLKSALSASAR